MSDYLDPVVVALEGRDQQLLDTLRRAKEEIRRWSADVGRMSADVSVKLDDSSVRRVEAALAHLTRDRTVRILADADTRVAAADLDLLTRARQARIIADADTRAAADDLALLTRPRTVTIHTNTTGNQPNSPTPTPGGGRGSSGGGEASWKSLLTLAPALVPIAAQATAVAMQMGAATVAVGVFGLAVKSQLGAVSGLSDAQAKANAAVAKYGPASKQAQQAQQALSQVTEAMPAQTLKAATAFSILQGDFQSWSNGLAKFTMVPVTQGIAVLDALLPKLSPLVKGTAAQFTRLTTLLAGGINSGAFDGIMAKFTAFANGALNSAVNGVIHFARVLSQGGGSNGFSTFMDYVKSTAPLVKETLKNLGEALMNILRAASQAGPGMLSLINAFAKLVAALPPSLIATIMQVAAAIKILSLTRAGITSLTGSFGGLRTQFTALRTAAAGAGGGLAGLRAAFLSLGTAAKATVVVAGIAAVVVAVSKLASLGQKAPPDVDKLTNSLGRLGSTGQLKGEALNAFGKNLSGLRDAVKSFVAPSVMDNIQQGIIKVVTLGTTDSTPVKEAKENIKAIDQALANLVQGGHADLAAAALEKLKAAYAKGGHDVGNFTGNLKNYKKAVDDAKFAADLTAQSQGLFGAQAQRTATQLDKQKASADGLRGAIQALNDVNRAGLGGMIAFNQSLADTAKAAKTNAGALTMSHGQLNLNSQKARDAASALQDLATKTDEAAGSARDSGASWGKVNSIYSQGRAALIKNAEAMGLTASQAKTLADQILKIPDKKAKVQMDTEDAVSDLNSFNAAVKRAPNAKSVTLKTLSSTAEQVLASFGYKVTHLKNGQVKVSAATGSALAGIRNVQGAVNSLHGKTITIMTQYFTAKSPSQLAAAHGRAHGGIAPGYADGGHVIQTHPNGGLVDGPGTPTSDSIVEVSPNGGVYRTSRKEYIVQAASVEKYGVSFLDALNAGHLRLAGYAKGGLSQAAKDARSQLSGSFNISSFGREAGYWRTPFEHSLAVPTDINELVSSLNGFRSEIKKAFSGRTESSLLKQLDKAGKSLISYDKQLTKVTSSLASAKSKLDDLKNSAAQLKSSVASSVMQNAGIVTSAPQEGFALSSQDVLNNLSAQVSKSIAFSNQLQALKKKGLSAELLEQIASAGVDQGGATAAALVGASDSTIKQLNSMQSQLKTSANKAGTAVSDAMYGAGIKAAEGLVHGLEKKQKAIEAQMLKIAKGMEKSIKHALGIKSPSTVMAQVGDFTALGMAAGITRSSKHAVIAARGMAMSVAQGATVAGVGTPTWAGVPLNPNSGMAAIVNHHYHFKIEGNAVTMDRLAKDVETAFLKRGARNPMTYTPYQR